jgi:hypothetical protein
MGVALHTLSVTGEQSDYPVINLEEALIIFNSMPWEKEMEVWEEMAEEDRENCMPLFHLMDDTEHALRLTAYSRDLVGLAYDYSIRGRMTFAGPEFEQGYFGTDQFPRASIRELLTLFFTSDEDHMLALLQRYPDPEVTDTDEESPGIT